MIEGCATARLTLGGGVEWWGGGTEGDSKPGESRRVLEEKRVV